MIFDIDTASTPAESLELRSEIALTLARRSVSGVFAYVLLLTIFFVATPAIMDSPSVAVVGIAWMTVLAAVRLVIARRFEPVYERNPTRWDTMFRCATLIAGASWGIGCAYWTHVMGNGSGTMIMLVSTAGIAAGATTSLGPSLRLANAYLVCILGPTIICFALDGDGTRTAFGFVAIMVLYLAFLMLESKRAHDAFVLAVHRTFILSQRADELAERTRRMKVILDTVGQGFLSVTTDGRMANERSAILDRWLGAANDDEPVWDYLGRTAPEAAVWPELGLTSLEAGIMSSDTVLEQMPRQFRARERHIEIEYRPTFVDGCVTRVLMILSDVTSDVERKRSAEEQRELICMFERISTDRRGVIEFVTESNRLAEELATNMTAADTDVRRWAHTLKGNAGLFGLEGLARTCHEMESLVEESGQPWTASQRSTLVDAWNASARRIRTLLGGDDSLVRVTRDDYIAVLDAVQSGVSRDRLVEILRGWQLEPSELRLARIADQARGLARRLGKGDIAVVVEPNGLRLPHERLADFWSAFVHVVRNAVDHGLEAPDERLAVGKRPAGTLTVRTHLTASELVVSLEDDGRGIDWERVAERARARGLPHDTRTDLEAALFVDGFSTSELTTEISGRGVGMSAVRCALDALGGRLALFSEFGRITRWTASIPRSSMEFAGDAKLIMTREARLRDPQALS